MREQPQHARITTGAYNEAYTNCVSCKTRALAKGGYRSHYTMEKRPQPCPTDWMPEWMVVRASGRQFKGGVPKECRHPECGRKFDELWLWTRVTAEKARLAAYKVHEGEYYYLCEGEDDACHTPRINWVGKGLLKPAGERGPM